MKTLIITIGSILISVLFCSAQDMKFGLLTGFNISYTRFTKLPDNLGDMLDFDPMITFNVNGYVGYKSDGFWGLSMEPGFIQKGSLHNLNGESARFHLNYIQMPVLVDFILLDRLFLSAGPEIGWMINAKAKGDDYSNDVSDIYDNRFELSGLIGLNYNLIEYLDIGIRYNHGLTYISKIAYTDTIGNETGENFKEYNQYLQFILRFKIKTGANKRV